MFGVILLVRRCRGARLDRVVLLTCLIALAGCGGREKPKPTATPTPNTAPQTSPAPRGVVLGEHGFVSGRMGWGSARPVQLDVGGDPALVIHRIRWRGWGRSQASGVGMALVLTLVPAPAIINSVQR